jgi:hypothetical protein
MNPWLRHLAIYSPAIALLVAGIVVLVVVSTRGAPPCTCTTTPNGTFCPTCATTAASPDFGLLLLGASGLYAFVAFLVRLTIRLNPPIRA